MLVFCKLQMVGLGDPVAHVPHMTWVAQEGRRSWETRCSDHAGRFTDVTSKLLHALQLQPIARANLCLPSIWLDRCTFVLSMIELFKG